MIIISLVLVGSVFIPYYFLERNGRAGRKQWRDAYDRAVKEHHLNIISEEAWEQNYIGIDPHLRKLLFIKNYETFKVDEVIDLDKVVGCKIIENRKYPKIRDKKISVLERLDLELSLDHNGNNLLLNLYDIKVNFSEDYEVRRAEKLKLIILNHIHSYHRGSKVA